MKMSTKLFIAGAILFVLAFVMPFAATFSVLCLVAGFALVIFQGIMEIINKGKTPKKGKDTTPPWEQ